MLHPVLVKQENFTSAGEKALKQIFGFLQLIVCSFVAAWSKPAVKAVIVKIHYCLEALKVINLRDQKFVNELN
jgi:hypothetical protein